MGTDWENYLYSLVFLSTPGIGYRISQEGLLLINVSSESIELRPESSDIEDSCNMPYLGDSLPFRMDLDLGREQASHHLLLWCLLYYLLIDSERFSDFA